MSEAYAYETRLAVVMMAVNGRTIREAANYYDVPYSTAGRWRREFELEGRLEAKPRGGDRRSQRSEQHAERIVGWVEAQCDTTISELCERLAELGHSLARSTVWCLLRRKGSTLKKKTVHAREQERDDVQKGRRLLIREQTSPSGRLAGKNVVCIDECSINTKMARTHGWAKYGERCETLLPHGHCHNTTLLAGMGWRGMLASLVLPGALDGPTFLYWIENMLLKEVGEDDVVICDNLAVHKVAGVQEALARAGVGLLYLPPYSPEFNPIEKAFSQIKAHLRKIAARTYEELVDATGEAIARVTPEIACNYIRGCGYKIMPSHNLVN